MIKINTAMDRGGKVLKREIEESTQSHLNLALLKRGNSIDAEILLDEGNDNDESGPTLAVILIDEGTLSVSVIYISYHLWLDYIPHLRNIASIKAEVEKNLAILSTIEGGGQF